MADGDGRCGQSRRDLISKFGIALKEANESEYWLEVIVAAEVLPPEEVSELLRESRELARMIGRSIVTARKNDPKPVRTR